MKEIPVYKPLLEQEEKDAAVKAIDMGWLGMGSYVGELEDAIKDFIEAKDRYFVATSSGTAGLHLALLAAGLKEGDEVILPSFLFVGVAQAIKATGAEPVFCDIYEDTLCINVEAAEKLISERTKAIVGVDYSCNLCDHDRLAELAKKYGLRIIHDAAHSFSSKYKGRMVGSFSDICVFSFDAVKNITCIDGGMVILKNEEEQSLVQDLRLVGMMQSTSATYKNERPIMNDVQRVGFRYHMPNLHAAIGLAQLKKIERIVESRSKAAIYYNEKLSRITGLKVPKSDFSDITPFFYYIRVPQQKKEALRSFLKEKGIGTLCHWIPMHNYTLFKDCRRGDLSITDKVGSEIITIPLHPDMDRKDQDEVIKQISNFFNK